MIEVCIWLGSGLLIGMVASIIYRRFRRRRFCRKMLARLEGQHGKPV